MADPFILHSYIRGALSRQYRSQGCSTSMVKNLILSVAVCFVSSCAHLKDPKFTELEAALVGQWEIRSVTANGVIRRTDKKQYEMTLSVPNQTGSSLYRERGEWTVVGNIYTMTCTFSDPLIPNKTGSVLRAELLSVEPNAVLLKYPDSPVVSEMRRGN